MKARGGGLPGRVPPGDVIGAAQDRDQSRMKRKGLSPSLPRLEGDRMCCVEKGLSVCRFLKCCTAGAGHPDGIESGESPGGVQ